MYPEASFYATAFFGSTVEYLAAWSADQNETSLLTWNINAILAINPFNNTTSTSSRLNCSLTNYDSKRWTPNAMPSNSTLKYWGQTVIGILQAQRMEDPLGAPRPEYLERILNVMSMVSGSGNSYVCILCDIHAAVRLTICSLRISKSSQLARVLIMVVYTPVPLIIIMLFGSSWVYLLCLLWFSSSWTFTHSFEIAFNHCARKLTKYHSRCTNGNLLC